MDPSVDGDGGPSERNEGLLFLVRNSFWVSSGKDKIDQSPPKHVEGIWYHIA